MLISERKIRFQKRQSNLYYFSLINLLLYPHLGYVLSSIGESREVINCLVLALVVGSGDADHRDGLGNALPRLPPPRRYAPPQTVSEKCLLAGSPRGLEGGGGSR